MGERKQKEETTIEREGITEAYKDVRSDDSDISWLLCKYDGNNIKLAGTGVDFEELQEHLKDDETAYAFARIIAGDELSKRAKFVFITWAGENLGTMQRAKLSVDKRLVQDITQNFALEISAVSPDGVSLDEVKAALNKASGADYGTGERE